MSSSNASTAEFSKLRQILWPIHGFEMKKFLPMFVMFGCVSLNYSLLRLTKDTLVVNAASSGAAVLPYLKLWCTTPAAILFMMFYIKLASMLSRKNLFYAAMLPFLLFFLIFPYALFPNIDVLHPTTSADALAAFLPAGLHGLVEVYRNWTFSIFYVMAELWGSICLSTLFWGCANEVTKVSEAKRFYGFLGIGANIPLLFVGSTVKKILSLNDWGASIRVLMGICFVVAVCVMALYWYLNNVVMEDPRFKITEVKKKKKKVKMGFMQSLKVLSTSKYLACLAFMVLAYGVSVNLVEVSWKQYVKELFKGDNAGYLQFTSNWMSYTGLASIIFMLFGTSNSLRILGWGKTALITPVVLFVASAAFFGNLMFEDVMMGLLGSLSMSPLFIACWIGGFHNTFGKSSKYSFFDPTKEIAYIPLDEHTKKTGKAAIDGVGGRLGKSGGAAINMILIGILGSVEAMTSYVGVITLVTIGFWIVAVNALNKQFVALTEKPATKSAEESEKSSDAVPAKA